MLDLPCAMGDEVANDDPPDRGQEDAVFITHRGVRENGRRGQRQRQMLALDLDGSSLEVARSCLEQGFLVNSIAPGTLRFVPPLIVTRRDIDTDQTLRANW